MIRKIIAKVTEKEDLTEEETRKAISEIMEGKATSAQIASFLTALRMKGETVEEIAGCAKEMLNRASSFDLSEDVLVDTCGTGGDGSNTFNISTAVAFVVAGVGLVVAKHGNRALSSRCGSADVLEALGVKLDISLERLKECLKRIGIGLKGKCASFGSLPSFLNRAPGQGAKKLRGKRGLCCSWRRWAG